MVWTNELRKAVIRELEHASYSQQSDFYRFLQSGVTLSEIGILDYVRAQLKAHPFLLPQDFLEKDISLKAQERVLGGLCNFKELIGIQKPTFSEWLTTQNTSNGLAIPYWVYVHFADEIKENFIESHVLVRGLSIELDERKQFRYFELPKVARSIVPSNNLELAVVATMLLTGNYQYIRFDREESVLRLKNLMKDYEVDIEVSCLASQLEGKTAKAISVINDSELSQRQKIYRIQDFVRV